MNSHLTESEHRFVDDVARLLVPWGMPQTAARMYGFLLLSPEPVSLDGLTAALQISKSNASVAARLLEKNRLVRRFGERGSRRVLYEVSENYEGILTEQNRLLQTMADLLRAGARQAGSGTPKARLAEMAEFYLVTCEAMETALRQWRHRHRQP